MPITNQTAAVGCMFQKYWLIGEISSEIKGRHRVWLITNRSCEAFEEKTAEIIALWMVPPQHAAMFCINEQTVIQALDRQGSRQSGGVILLRLFVEPADNGAVIFGSVTGRLQFR
jgi:hypothetical protein